MAAIIMTNGRFANERIKNYEEVPEAIEQSGGIFRSSYLKTKRPYGLLPTHRHSSKTLL